MSHGPSFKGGRTRLHAHDTPARQPSPVPFYGSGYQGETKKPTFSVTTLPLRIKLVKMNLSSSTGDWRTAQKKLEAPVPFLDFQRHKERKVRDQPAAAVMTQHLGGESPAACESSPLQDSAGGSAAASPRFLPQGWVRPWVPGEGHWCLLCWKLLLGLN